MCTRIKKSSNRWLNFALIVVAVLVLGPGAGHATDLPPGPESPGAVKQVKVLPDKAPDCSSLKSIAETVTRGCKTNDAKAIAIYNFMLLSHYHCLRPPRMAGFPR